MKKIALIISIILFFTTCHDGNIPDVPETPEPIIKFPRTYDESVRKVEFNGSTATITFNNLTHNDIYLVKINNSDKDVDAVDTGGVKTFLPSIEKIVLNRSSSQIFSVETVFPLPIMQESSSIESQSVSIPPYVGDKKEERFFDSFVQHDVYSTLMAIGKHSYIWIADYQEYTTWNSGGEETVIKEFLPTVTYEQAREIAARFDLIYSIMTKLYDIELFYEGANSDLFNKYGDSRVILEFYLSKGSWAGKYIGSRALGKTLYLSSNLLNNVDSMTTVMIHEFQHLINAQIIERDRRKQFDWYDEMLAYMAMEVFSSPLGIPSTSGFLPQAEINEFNKTGRYYQYGFPQTTDWVYIFGAYLMRNYGGVYLFKEIVTNNKSGYESLTLALNKIQEGLTFEKAFSRFGEAMIFSGPMMPMGTMSFDKSFSSSINGIDYKLNGFNIWNDFYYKPIVFNLEPKDMRPYSLILQTNDEWKNITGNISISLEEPVDENIELYLMVQ